MASKKSLSRRKFLAGSVAGVAASGVLLGAQENTGSRQATGVKVDEVSDTSAISTASAAASSPSPIRAPPSAAR